MGLGLTNHMLSRKNMTVASRLRMVYDCQGPTTWWARTVTLSEDSPGKVLTSATMGFQRNSGGNAAGPPVKGVDIASRRVSSQGESTQITQNM